MYKFTLLIVCLAVAACGDQAGQEPFSIRGNNTNNTNNANNADSFVLACGDTTTPVGLEGSVYTDVDDAANSMYQQAPPEGRTGLAGIKVNLLASDGESWSTTTCEDGSFRFGELAADKAFLVDPEIDGRVTTVNDTSNLFAVMSEGKTNLLVFGDSIPVFGPTPWFPTVLESKLGVMGEVEMNNIAIPGTVTGEWLPGTANFNLELLPRIKDADVIVFSLGGNDFLNFISTLQGDPDPASRLSELQPLVTEIKANLNTIIDRIQLTNPNADIVWILYPNYAVTEEWKGFLGTYANVAVGLVKNMLIDVRKDLAQQDRLVMIDMFEATKDVDLDAMIIDPLHLNVKGHAFYAAEIARALGVVEAGTTPLRYDFGVEP